jgi:protein-L-isoaspartate(D-aspartate) O-methyltransferase
VLPEPLVIATMLEALSVGSLDRVLEVGTQGGYQSALLAELGGRVTSVTRDPEAAAAARRALAEEGYQEVKVVVRDGSKGFDRAAPYDAIMVNEAAVDPPEPLIDQLAPGGRLVMAIGDPREEQTLYRFCLEGYELEREEIGRVRFRPLRGLHGLGGETPPIRW